MEVTFGGIRKHVQVSFSLHEIPTLDRLELAKELVRQLLFSDELREEHFKGLRNYLAECLDKSEPLK